MEKNCACKTKTKPQLKTQSKLNTCTEYFVWINCLELHLHVSILALKSYLSAKNVSTATRANKSYLSAKNVSTATRAFITAINESLFIYIGNIVAIFSTVKINKLEIELNKYFFTCNIFSKHRRTSFYSPQQRCRDHLVLPLFVRSFRHSATNSYKDF